MARDNYKFEKRRKEIAKKKKKEEKRQRKLAKKDPEVGESPDVVADEAGAVETPREQEVAPTDGVDETSAAAETPAS